MIRRWERWGIAVLALLMTALIVACQGSTSTIRERSSSAGCYSVEHFAGTACVPHSVERLVTLDGVSFEHAIALGVKPVATVIPSLPSHVTDRLDGVEDIGQAGSLALERILTLKPDLILGLDFHQNIYPQTSQIAPTVLFKFEHSGQWKKSFQAIAQALDREDAAQQVMENYNKRLEEFKAKLGVGAASPEENRRPVVSVVRIYPQNINPYLRDSFPGTVLQDAGLARPQGQDIGADEAQRIANNPIQMTLSRESLSEIDGDVLFIWTAEDDVETNQEAQENLEKLKNDPLWKTLNVVKNNHVYFVPSYWIGSGPIAANAILDDLFKYLIETPQP